MYRLIESIKLEDGVFHLLNYHQARMDRSVFDLFGTKNRISLYKILHALDFPKMGLFKCRIVYSDKVDDVEFIPYEVRTISTLKVVVDDTLEYSHKYMDRSRLQLLFDLRDNCDDVLIVKKGMITDSSYSNVIFFDGYNWVTPEQPLLKGVMRQFLLDSGKIKEGIIALDDLSKYKSCRLINAMLGFAGPEIEVSSIVS